VIVPGLCEKRHHAINIDEFAKRNPPIILRNFLLNTGTLVNKIKIKSNKSKKSKSKISPKTNATILRTNNNDILVKGCNLAINESVGIYEKNVFDKVEVEILLTFLIHYCHITIMFKNLTETFL
jgi:hypothetical protein